MNDIIRSTSIFFNQSHFIRSCGEEEEEEEGDDEEEGSESGGDEEGGASIHVG
jgi:hypothetical protein